MKRILTLALVASTLFGCSVLQAQETDFRLMLHSGEVLPGQNLDAFISSEIPDEELFEGYYYRYIQFYRLPDEEKKEIIRKSGIQLLYYMPYHAFMAAIPAGYDRSLLKGFNVRSVVKQDPMQKLHALLLAGVPAHAVNEKGTADIRVQYHRNISGPTATAEAALLGEILDTRHANRVITIRMEAEEISPAAGQHWISYMEPVAPPSYHDDFRGRSLHRSNAINTELPMGRRYNGAGVGAALADDGAVGPHIDYTGRLTNHLTSAGGTHGDMTGGILAGAGNLNPVNQGMADSVDLHVFGIGGYPQIVNAVSNNATLGTTISSTSYSQGCNSYTTDTQFGDQTTRDNPHLVFVFSAGNNGAADCGYGAGTGWGNITGGYKQGKNVIACANLNAQEALTASSSRGPASDGRIKPDIAANGTGQISTAPNNGYLTGGGTSAACPGIAGISAQLTQAYKELYAATDAPTALIKACLLNGAEDIGNSGPDFIYGWGRVNALRSVQILEDGNFTEDMVTQGAMNTHNIAVPANVSELRVMVYWHDQGGVPLAAVSLVNDLDITVTDPSLVDWQPWVLDHTPVPASLSSPATRGADHLNNMEQVTIDNPPTGNYMVSVSGFAVPSGPQEYFLVYLFRTDDIYVTYPIGGEGFVPGEQEWIRWDALKGLGSFNLDYSTDGGTTWASIATGINQNTLQYNWTVPNTLSGEARVRVTRGAVTGMTPDNFSIIGRPSNINVDWACPDSVRLTWNAVAGAASYEVSILGASHMDSVGTSLTTDIVLYGLNPMNSYWFSVRAVHANGSKGRRANAIYKSPGTFNCPLADDVRVISLISPPGGSYQDCQGMGSVPVTVQFENNGQGSATNITIRYSLNGAAPVTYLYPGPLAPLQVASYTFSSTLNMSTAGTYSVQAWIEFSGDQNTYNDSVTTLTNVTSGTLTTLPFQEDFEAFPLCPTTYNCEQTVCVPGNGFVNETNLVEDDIDFRTDQGGTPSNNTGPAVDNTLGTAQGNYMYLEASNGCYGQAAHLVTPCFDLTSIVVPEMTFWYHMYGTSMGSLHVDVLSQGSWDLDVMPAITGNQGNAWLQATVSLAAYAGEVINIRFRGITGSNWSSDVAIDDFGIYDTGSPLPVSWLSFSGTHEGGHNLLEWQTASELQNKGFFIERSVDGMAYATIGFVEGAGNSTEIRHYTYRDNDVHQQVYYYRLRQMDFDGRQSYSNVIVIRSGRGNGSYFVYPTLVTDVINVVTESQERVYVRLFDVTGKTVLDREYSADGHLLRIPVADAGIAPGFYMLVIDPGGQPFTTKLLKR